jgi:hypothetical protein
MNRNAQSMLWLVALSSLILFISLVWISIFYDAIHEAYRIESVVDKMEKNYVPPENRHRHSIHTPKGWIIDGGFIAEEE